MTIATVLPVFGFLGPLHDPRVLAELRAHLFDHLAGGPADRLDRQRREQVDHDPADQQADQDVGIGQVEETAEVEALGRLGRQLRC